MKEITVLLIEDEPSFQLALKTLLHRDPATKYNLVIESWLRDGLKRLAHQDIDIVLLDLTLPDSHGLDTLLQIRQQSSFTPVVVLTGREDDMGVEALKLGAQDYLLKGRLDGSALMRSMRYAIERANLIEERDNFIAALTHDLRNPLVGANRILELLYQGHLGEIDSTHAELLTKVFLTNEQLLAMIQNLLDVYRLEKDINALVLAHTNLLDLVNYCIEQVRPLALKKKVKLESLLEPQTKPVLADEPSFRRVVHNLLDNALKFTPEGGSITVSLFERTSRIILVVKDSGPGILQEDRRRVFQRFGRGDPAQRHNAGIGLGLFVCKQIVELHGGSIDIITDRDAEGSVFEVQLPFSAIESMN